MKRLLRRLWFWWNFRIKGAFDFTSIGRKRTEIRQAVRKREADQRIIAEWMAEAEAEGLDMSHRAIANRLGTSFEQGDWDESPLYVESDREEWLRDIPTPQEELFQRSFR